LGAHYFIVPYTIYNHLRNSIPNIFTWDKMK